MYEPYDPYKNNDDSQNSSSEDAGRVNGEYSYIRPEKNYSDAGYTPVGSNSTPRYNYTPAEPQQKPKKSNKGGFGFGRVVALCLICAILGGGAGALVTNVTFDSDEAPAISEDVGKDTTVQTTPKPSTASPVVSGKVMQPTDIYTLACQQTVGVTTEITQTNTFGMTSSSSVTGSGFIYSSDGYIITNYHVIEDAATGGYDIYVMLYDGQSYPATIIGSEKDNDVAVLKIDIEGLNAVTIGDSDSMQVGESVYAVGNPLGELAYTMTSGMVSALNREISTDDSTTINMFQIDAAVNSGNSGGPVYDSQGQVIGIVTAKYSSSGVEGLGFAIPINDALSIAQELIEKGYVSGKAYMGVTVTTVPSSVAQYYNMVVGAYIYALDKNSCAAEAGLQIGDIITKVADREVASSSDLIAAKKQYRAGDTASLTVYRNGEYLDLQITFDEQVPQVDNTPSTQNQQQQQFPGIPSW